MTKKFAQWMNRYLFFPVYWTAVDRSYAERIAWAAYKRGKQDALLANNGGKK